MSFDVLFSLNKCNNTDCTVVYRILGSRRTYNHSLSASSDTSAPPTTSSSSVDTHLTSSLSTSTDSSTELPGCLTVRYRGYRDVHRYFNVPAERTRIRLSARSYVFLFFELFDLYGFQMVTFVWEKYGLNVTRQRRS